jgi:hypothetical protein
MVACLVVGIYREIVGRAVKLITRRTDQRCESRSTYQLQIGWALPRLDEQGNDCTPLVY